MFRSTDGDGQVIHQYFDDTDRKDSTCRYYTMSSPITLTIFDGVNFNIKVDWNVGGTAFGITRTTFVLQPTDTMSPPFTDVTVLLSETNVSVDLPGTNAP